MSDLDITRCGRLIREVVGEQCVEDLARETGFCRKRRKLTPLRAVWTFVTGMASGKIDSIADLRRLFMDLTGESISYKPFHDRLSVAGFPDFFRKLLEHFMSRLLMPVYHADGYTRSFSDIWIQDGTSFGLNSRLSGAFAGRFTNKAPAAVELHCTYSLMENQAVSISVAPDVESERDFLPEPTELNGKLLLQDAGYLKISYMNRVKAAGGEVICPFRGGRANPRILTCYRGFDNDRKVVGKKLKDVKLPRKNVDLYVQCATNSGRKHEQIRLVLVYIPKEKKHILLYTTLDHRKFPTSRVGALYRLRWQIELFFKECKSYTDLKKFRTADPHIAEGVIWASMAAALFRRFLLHCAFVGTGKRSAPFVAASMSWLFFLDLGRSGVSCYRRLPGILERILSLLRKFAQRTNPQRADTFAVLGIVP